MSQEIIEGEVTEQPLAVRETFAPAEWTPRFATSVDDQLAMLRERDRFYRERLKEGVHYGVIPGTQKPTLYKPGAEALLSGMGLRSETGNESPPILDFTGKDHGGEPFIMYDRYCRIYRQTGPTVNDRIEVANLGGACNSWEPKYRYRNSSRVCPQCGKEAIIKGKADYGGGWVCFKKKDGCGAKFRDGDAAIESQNAGKVANEDVSELQNTIKKMADKRALIAATLVATGCSDIFTQGVEDMPATMAAQGEPRNVTPPAAKAAPKAPPVESPAEATRRRKEGIKNIHVWCANRGIDTSEKDGLYKFVLRDTFEELFRDKPDEEVSSTKLDLVQLQQFSRALQAFVARVKANEETKQ
jgi:hypothetical protein